MLKINETTEEIDKTHSTGRNHIETRLKEVMQGLKDAKAEAFEIILMKDILLSQDKHDTSFLDTTFAKYVDRAKRLSLDAAMTDSIAVAEAEKAGSKKFKKVQAKLI